MRKLLLQLLILAATFFNLPAYGQNKLSIDKVYSVTLRNSGPILENEQIKLIKKPMSIPCNWLMRT